MIELGGDELIDYIILKELDKKLKLPVEIDHSYDGAGYETLGCHYLL